MTYHAYTVTVGLIGHTVVARDIEEAADFAVVRWNQRRQHRMLIELDGSFERRGCSGATASEDTSLLLLRVVPLQKVPA